MIKENNTKFSIIIPARNEEKRLPNCIMAINESYKDLISRIKIEQHQFSLEIIVVENRSEDRTFELANQLATVVTRSDAKNLSIIRNTGARLATGEIIVTIDADSIMSKRTLYDVYKSLASNSFIGGGVLIYPDRYSLGIICSVVLLVPLVLYYRISAGLFFCYREDFWAINGFNEELVSLEDVDFAVRLKKHGKTKGKRFKTLLWSYITTSARKFDKFGDWYFFTNPLKTYRLFMGKSQSDADEVWYEFRE